MTDFITRIGPRKLRRVLQHAKDSTITRQPSDFRRDPSISSGPLPTIIEGSSYFDLPRSAESCTPNSVISPKSFMNASSAKTPEMSLPVGRKAETPAEQPASNDDQRGGVILLVEDNAINMRVSLPVAVFRFKSV